ncbi:MAG: GDSL-type esterase/lipase family protein [Planctomycetaceae bacterium]
MKKTWMTFGTLVLIGLLGLPLGKAQGAEGPSQVEVKDSAWHGFTKHSFQVEGYNAYVVSPAVAAPGNPWVWRTSFPDFHAEIDIELARSGFHIGFVDVVDLLGSDRSLDVMDKFYEQARFQWNLAEKAAIEPCSRGGLHAYRYTARHPERVACIYADTPVMDFKSWPLQRKEKAGEWPKILKWYGFKDDAEAMAFKGNPVDQLEPLVKAKIPQRHVVCLVDKVVPPENNTFEAARRQKAMGLEMELVIVPQSDQLEGHHFPVPEVFASARFVMKHASVMPKAQEYFELREGVSNAFTKFAKEKVGRVAFLGGSITHSSGWRDETMTYLTKRFPETKFDFIAAGNPSCGSVPHAFRLEQDILSKGEVDLLFVEAAVNDGTNIFDKNASTNTKPEDALLGMEGVIRHVRLNSPKTDVVMMHFVMPSFMEEYRQGKTPEVIAQHEKVAKHYGVASLNLALEVTDRIDAKQFTWEKDFRDLHPSPFGHRLYANSIGRLLDAGYAAAQGKDVNDHGLPAEPLDARSFFKGRFGAITTARDLKDFVAVPKSKSSWGGYPNMPTLEASKAGASFSFDFEGTACGLFIYAGPETGVVQYRVDGGEWNTLDTFTAWSGGNTLPWAVMLERELKPGKHAVDVRLSEAVNANSKGPGLQVMYFLQN